MPRELKPDGQTKKSYQKHLSILVVLFVSCAVVALIIVSLLAGGSKGKNSNKNNAKNGNNSARVKPKVAYKAVKACDILTMKEARALFGGKQKVAGNVTEPVVNGNTATSKCSYNVVTPNDASKVVAAVAVRTGINKAGVAQNRKDFKLAQAANDTKEVSGIGEKAYFNRNNGQLYVLKNKEWIIISYGSADDPTNNSIENAKKLAKLVVD